MQLTITQLIQTDINLFAEFRDASTGAYTFEPIHLLALCRDTGGKTSIQGVTRTETGLGLACEQDGYTRMVHWRHCDRPRDGQHSAREQAACEHAAREQQREAS